MVVSVADGLLRPRWRGRLHALAFVASVPLLPLLLLEASTLRAGIALGVYGASVTLLYGTSAAYHILSVSHRSQVIMRRLDHSMIFVQIAGTYTPVCLLALPPNWGWPLLATVWGLAAIGIAVKVSANATLMRLSNVSYLLVAWVAVAAVPALVSNLEVDQLFWLLLGGLLYTGGALLFAVKKPTLWPTVFGFHEVWHLFTILAGLAHLFMVLSITVGYYGG